MADVLELEVDGLHWSVPWGRADVIGSPSFWVDQTERAGFANRVNDLRVATCIERELVFCLLGGFGVSAEAATVALEATWPLIEAHDEPCDVQISAVLREPLGDGRRYRFPNQRAARIAAAISALRASELPDRPVDLRNHLLALPGVGPKTASWIVRNITGSGDVAIIDIWICRALQANGIFPKEWEVARHYFRFEAVFLAYANSANVHAGALDLCIWTQARKLLPIMGD